MTRIVVLLCISASALAQQSVIEHCRNTSSDADRIACLEAALLAKEPVVSREPASPIVAPVQTTGPEPEGIGADQVVARTQTQEQRLEELEKAEGLVVASYATVPYEKLQVTLQNGQVWRQIVGDTQKIRVSLKRNQTVDISESSISGYKMQLNEMRRSVRVERVK
ncbi:MAG: hypothetical protein ACR2QT_02605 [Woeseiaceae bacterium]